MKNYKSKSHLTEIICNSDEVVKIGKQRNYLSCITTVEFSMDTNLVYIYYTFRYKKQQANMGYSRILHSKNLKTYITENQIKEQMKKLMLENPKIKRDEIAEKLNQSINRIWRLYMKVRRELND